MTTISSGVSGMSNWGGMPPRMEGRGGGQKPSFADIDTDSSGGLDKAELQSMLEKGPQGVQGAQGTQGSSGVDDLFSKLDSDGDGTVTQTELDKGMKPPGHEHQDGQNPFGSMGMDTQGFAAMMSGGNSDMATGTDDAQEALFGMMDEDQSGDVSKTEFTAFQDKMKTLFEKMQQMGAMQSGSPSSGVSLSA